jgi:riboflavin-specific deaminase-like protein
MAPDGHDEPPDEARAWDEILALAERSGSNGAAHAEAEALRSRWCGASTGRSSLVQLVELFLPLCARRSQGYVFAHVGQSIDGQIATGTGVSRYVTGPENIKHLHRLRALSDAVLIGASTVEYDDPRLTTRLVPGKSPARVVIDPTLRLPVERQVFQDRAAPTYVVCAKGRANGRRLGSAEVVEVPAEGGLLPPGAIVSALRERGLSKLFIEGGGVTVSRFLQARALHRLQVTIGPLFIGQGRPGISLPAIDGLESALRPKTRRFDLGEDVLFDCDFAHEG